MSLRVAQHFGKVTLLGDKTQVEGTWGTSVSVTAYHNYYVTYSNFRVCGYTAGNAR